MVPSHRSGTERSADIYYGMGIEGQTVLEVGAFAGFMPSHSIMELSSASRHCPQTGWGFNSLCMHAYLKSFGFETVLEFPTPTDPENRSIFIGIKPGYFKEYIEANQQYAKPRFDGT